MLSCKGIEDIQNDESVGFQLISTDDIDDFGIPTIITQIRQRVGKSPVYLRYLCKSLYSGVGSMVFTRRIALI